ncbi:hypothetical protein JNJ66_00900 [Candidatus Saccharibacteria bacterium]|nr:hypothetical protein [Candidatus Saccharibacteria bacterium]
MSHPNPHRATAHQPWIHPGHLVAAVQSSPRASAYQRASAGLFCVTGMGGNDS